MILNICCFPLSLLSVPYFQMRAIEEKRVELIAKRKRMEELTEDDPELRKELEGNFKSCVIF